MTDPIATIPATARQAKIRQLLSERESVSISQLADLLGVSEMTIRRDLEMLERRGQVRRTRGGAMAAERMVFEFDFHARRQANHRAKLAIARWAADQVKDGSTIILDTGTTTLELACLLKDRSQLTVITPSLAVASELQFADGVQTVLLGGVLRAASPDLTGALTEANLDALAADIAFQGADAIDLAGKIYNADLQIAHVDAKMRTRAARTFILCDSTKIGQTALSTSGTLRDVDALITDDAIHADAQTALEKNGASIVIVPHAS